MRRLKISARMKQLFVLILVILALVLLYAFTSPRILNSIFIGLGGVMIVYFILSLEFPKEGTAKTVVTVFGNFVRIIGTWGKYSLNDPIRGPKLKKKNISNADAAKYKYSGKAIKYEDLELDGRFSYSLPEWEWLLDPKGVLDCRSWLEKKWNIYFVPFLLYTIYWRKIRYDYSLKLATELEDDEKILKKWKNPRSGIELVLTVRENWTDHVRGRDSHKLITMGVKTGYKDTSTTPANNQNPQVLNPQAGNAIMSIVVTNLPILLANNPYKINFSTTDPAEEIVLDIVSEALRSYIAEGTIEEFNLIESEKIDSAYSKHLKNINYLDPNNAEDGIADKYGYTLEQDPLQGFEPETEDDNKILGAINKVFIKKKDGEAYKLELFEMAEGQYRMLLRTGKIKVDGDGNITELVPDPDVKIWADSIAELAGVTGAVVLGDGVTAPMLDILKAKKQLNTIVNTPNTGNNQ